MWNILWTLSSNAYSHRLHPHYSYYTTLHYDYDLWCWLGVWIYIYTHARLPASHRPRSHSDLQCGAHWNLLVLVTTPAFSYSSLPLLTLHSFFLLLLLLLVLLAIVTVVAVTPSLLTGMDMGFASFLPSICSIAARYMSLIDSLWSKILDLFFIGMAGQK